jgi:hypothetical protein
MSDVQIFQLIGLAYLAIGVGMLLNQELYKKVFTDFVENKAILYMGGVMALVIGYLLVTFHNVWVCDWTVIITVVGWMALIKGMVILIRPSWIIDLTKAIVNKERFLKIEGIIVTVIGVLLLFLGFCPKSPLI